MNADELRNLTHEQWDRIAAVLLKHEPRRPVESIEVGRYL
jgi:hypothetical protein